MYMLGQQVRDRTFARPLRLRGHVTTLLAFRGGSGSSKKSLSNGDFVLLSPEMTLDNIFHQW